MAETGPTLTRRERKIATQQAILDAAITAFARQGYDGTNFRDITALSGAKRALILYYYKNKEALWKKSVQTVSDRFSHLMSQQLKEREHKLQDDSDEAQVRMALNAFLDTLEQVPEFGQILLREGTTEGPRLDWLAKHASPPSAIGFRLKNKELNRRINRTVLLDILSSTLISIITLAPLLDASLAAALRTKNAGINPLSKKRKAELVEHMEALALSDLTQ